MMNKNTSRRVRFLSFSFLYNNIAKNGGRDGRTLGRWASLALSLLMVLSAFVPMLALPTFAVGGVARDITKNSDILTSGFYYPGLMTDGEEAGGSYSLGSAYVTLTATEDIGALYISFNTADEEYTVWCGNESVLVGGEGFLHEYIDIGSIFGSTKSVKLSFSSERSISEIRVLSVGERPDFVQVWNEPTENADLLLFSSHSDDDQLYFAGLIPLYVSRGYNVQVAYFTYHPDTPVRRHELLNGLWAAGCRNYPIYDTTIPDFRIDNYESTMAEFDRRGFSREMLEEYIVSTVRRTHPLVLVTHEPEGEYGHGMHIALSALIRELLPALGDRTKYTDSAKQYGIWKVQKTYLHDYEEGKITLPIDTPLDYFGGRSAFAVSQDAFRLHTSQHYYSLTSWLYGSEAYPITKSSQITTDNPSYFGLFESLVGEDKNKNDMFENLLSYSEAEKQGTPYPSGHALLAESYESELDALKDRAEAAESALSTATEKIGSLEAELAKALEKIGTLEAELEAIEGGEGYSKLEAELEAERGRVSSLEGELEALRAEKEALEAELSDAKAKLEAFEDGQGADDGELDRSRVLIIFLSTLVAILIILLIVVIIILSIPRNKPRRRRPKRGIR